MAKLKMNTYWILLLAVLFLGSSVLSVGQTQARYTGDTTIVNTVVLTDSEKLASNHLVSDVRQVILLGGLDSFQSVQATFTLKALQPVKDAIYWYLTENDVIAVEIGFEMTEGEGTLHADGTLEMETDSEALVTLTITSISQITEERNVDVVVLCENLSGTFRVRLTPPAEDPTEPSEEEDPTDPTEGEDTEPTDPTEGENTEPTDPTEGEDTEPTDPAEGENTEPTDPTEGENTEPTDPTEGENTEPMDPTEGENTESTDPTEGENTESTDPTEEVTEAVEGENGESGATSESGDASEAAETVAEGDTTAAEGGENSTDPGATEPVTETEPPAESGSTGDAGTEPVDENENSGGETPDDNTEEPAGNTDDGTGDSTETPEDGTGDSTETPEDGTGDSTETPDDGTGDSTETPDNGTGDSTETPDDGTGDSNETPEDGTGDSTQNPDEETETDAVSQLLLKTFPEFERGATLPVSIVVGGQADSLMVGLAGGNPLPALTRYSPDGGATWYLMYFGGFITIEDGFEALEVAEALTWFLQLDFSGTTLEAGQEITLEARGMMAQKVSGTATAATKMVADSAGTGTPQILVKAKTVEAAAEPAAEAQTQAEPDKNSYFTVTLPVGWDSCFVEYEVAILQAGERGNAYVPVELTDLSLEGASPDTAGLYGRLDYPTRTLTIGMGGDLPAAGTYRLTIKGSFEGVCFQQMQMTFFINYSTRSDAE